MPFPESPRVLYRNTPLVEVICQLRFPTILEISSEEPAAFQKKIRAGYPLYSKEGSIDLFPKELSELVAGLAMPKPVELLTHKFLTEDSNRFISLTRDFLALTEHQYRRWEEFWREFESAKIDLEEMYKPAFYSRIGLRYQNVIDKAKLGLEHETWDSLLKPAFLGILGEQEVRIHVQQIRAEVLINIGAVQGGYLRLRHGLRKSKTEPHESYFIDADFFTSDREATSNVRNVLTTFNRLAGNLFRWAITPALHQHLNPRGIE